ncbi:MAG: DoxX family protein [Chloroflexi bacterium]|nr:DoxX family protein [Chloroflexota bacterium]
MSRATACTAGAVDRILLLLSAVGLPLPAVLNLAPFMVPVTVVCWVLLMFGAVFTHCRRSTQIRNAELAFISHSRPSPRRVRLGRWCFNG